MDDLIMLLSSFRKKHMAYRPVEKTSTLYCPKIDEGTQGLLHFFQEVLSMVILHSQLPSTLQSPTV